MTCRFAIEVKRIGILTRSYFIKAPRLVFRTRSYFFMPFRPVNGVRSPVSGLKGSSAKLILPAMTSVVPDLMVTPEPDLPPPTSIAIEADPALPKFDIAKVHEALKHPVRYRAMKMMANGAGLTATELSSATNTGFDMSSKHMRILLRAGLVQCCAHPDDARCAQYTIPKQFRKIPGVVDYGSCVLRFGVES